MGVPSFDPTSPRPGARPAVFLALLGPALLLPGCALRQQQTTMSSVPPEWRNTNPWGPEAWAARSRGELQPLFYTPQMAAWAQWARANVQEGDLLFRYGHSIRVTNRLANRLTTGLSDNRFTHNALAFYQGGEVWVYDVQVEPEGVRKMPFEFWMLDTVPDTLAVKRLPPCYRPCIPQALAYCEAAWLRQPPFDSALRLDDERLYCSEMIEKAFRSAGLSLSDPIPIRCLPHYHRYSFLRPLAERLSEIRVDQPVFALGNQWYGTYGSPCLQLVYGGDNRKHKGPPKPPTCPPVPFPAEPPGRE